MASAARPQVAQAEQGETPDAGWLFEQYSERIFGYCLRVLGSRTEAEDAVQTTFLYAHRALERGIVPESEYVWLHSIARNVCRWQKRTAARRNRFAGELDVDALPDRRGEHGDTELLLGLEEALASIPESQRRAILLREWQGLSCEEVAASLGTTTSAAHALLTRGRRSLARALTVLPSRPTLALDFGWLFKLKALVAGSAVNAAATTAVVAGAIVGGGIALERSIDAARAPTAKPAASERSGTAPRARSDAFERARARAGVVSPTVGARSAGDVRADAVVAPVATGGHASPSNDPSGDPPGALDDPRGGSPTEPAPAPASEEEPPLVDSEEVESVLDPILPPLPLDPPEDPTEIVPPLPGEEEDPLDGLLPDPEDPLPPLDDPPLPGVDLP